MKATVLLVQICISAFFIICLASADALDASDNARMDNLMREGASKAGAISRCKSDPGRA